MHYLNLYQKGHTLGPLNTFFAAAAPTLFLAGLAADSDKERQKSFYTWGIVVVFANFLISKTLQITNEANLERAIEEYNKRKTPKIRYGQGRSYPDSLQKQISFTIKKSWSF